MHPDAAPSPSSDLPRYLHAAASLLAGGKLDAAAGAYEEILAHRPDCTVARTALGTIAAQRGALDLAAARFEQAIAIEPNAVDALFSLAVVRQRQGRLDLALAQYRRALEIKPDLVEALVNAAALATQHGEAEEAVALARRACAVRPGALEVRWALANALMGAGQSGDAVALYRELLAMAPGETALLLNLGIALERDGRLDESEESFRRAAALNPESAETHLQLGNIATVRGDVARSIGHFRDAIARRPDFAEARFNLACALLSTGEFREGFELYDWRLRLPGAAIRDFAAPRWSGDLAEIRGRTILVHAEQGLGDTVQFVRYADALSAAGAQVVLQVQPQLRSLVARAFPGARVIDQGEAPPAADLHLPLLSLPRVLGTTADTVPAVVPYISADPARAREWARRLDGHRRRIGIVWAGNPAHSNDRRRSIGLALLGGALRNLEATIYSIQVGPRTADLRRFDLPITDLAPALRDFEDTAAVLANLDLVVSVDTAVCHLAGAMARPVWVLLPFAPDWRWRLEGQQSAWYPTMRVFRQRRPGDWSAVMAEIEGALQLSV